MKVGTEVRTNCIIDMNLDRGPIPKGTHGVILQDSSSEWKVVQLAIDEGIVHSVHIDMLEEVIIKESKYV